MDQIIKDNMPWVISIVNHFHPRNHTEREDLVDAGRIGLWKALQKHDPERGKLTTYSWLSIKWAVIREIGKIRSKNHLSIDSVSPPSAYRPEEVWEYFTSDITPEEKRLIELRCQGYNFREICEQVGGTPSTVKNHFCKALNKIKEGNNE